MKSPSSPMLASGPLATAKSFSWRLLQSKGGRSSWSTKLALVKEPVCLKETPVSLLRHKTAPNGCLLTKMNGYGVMEDRQTPRQSGRDGILVPPVTGQWMKLYIITTNLLLGQMNLYSLEVNTLMLCNQVVINPLLSTSPTKHPRHLLGSNHQVYHLPLDTNSRLKFLSFPSRSSQLKPPLSILTLGVKKILTQRVSQSALLALPQKVSKNIANTMPFKPLWMFHTPCTCPSQEATQELKRVSGTVSLPSMSISHPKLLTKFDFNNTNLSNAKNMFEFI